MLEMGISGKQIMFTDETQIKTGAFIKDSIRLSPENKEKLKTGKKEAFELINPLGSPWGGGFYIFFVSIFGAVAPA